MDEEKTMEVEGGDVDGEEGGVATRTPSKKRSRGPYSAKQNVYLTEHFVTMGKREGSSHHMCVCRYCKEDYDNKASDDENMPEPKLLMRCTRDCESHLRKCLSFQRRGLSYQPQAAASRVKPSNVETKDSTAAVASHIMLHPNLVISSSRAYKLLFTKIRDVNTTTEDFVKYSRRAMQILVEDALAELPATGTAIQTPCGSFHGVETPPPSQITAVSIVRAGDCLVEAVRAVEPGVRVGKILIQRNESSANKLPMHFYTKLPPDMENDYILLCDPMLATGGSALTAVQVLCSDRNVRPSQIIFVNLVCAPEGLKALAQAYPRIKIVTAAVDVGLNDSKHIVPGVGDFGDRFYGTCDRVNAVV